MLWRDSNQAPDITAASVISSHTFVATPHLLWTDPIKSQKVDGNNVDYEIPGQIPLEQLRFNLGQVNTLTPIQVQRYFVPTTRQKQGTWETLTHSIVYRLQSPHGEVTSPDLVLNSPPSDRLRAVLDANSVGNKIPTIQIGFVPQIVVFLARGDEPFTLAWGAKGVRDGSMSYATLLPGYRVDKEYSLSTATLQTMTPIPVNLSSPELADKNHKISKGLLWGILATGLLVLVGMAVMLLRQMRRNDPL